MQLEDTMLYFPKYHTYRYFLVCILKSLFYIQTQIKIAIDSTLVHNLAGQSGL